MTLTRLANQTDRPTHIPQATKSSLPWWRCMALLITFGRPFSHPILQRTHSAGIDTNLSTFHQHSPYMVRSYIS